MRLAAAQAARDSIGTVVGIPNRLHDAGPRGGAQGRDLPTCIIATIS